MRLPTACTSAAIGAASCMRVDSLPVPESYTAGEETAWTVRLPDALLTRLDERVETLNAVGKGRWSRKSLIVDVLADAAKAWDAEGAAS